MKPKLIMLQGLPGSGKSTWARAQPDAVRVNKDDIRRELKPTGWEWSPKAEKDVIEIRDLRIQDALTGGYTVISDDTNIAPKHKARLQQIAMECAADFEVKRFDTPIEVCLERDALRVGDEQVGPDVIHRMAKEWEAAEPAPVVQDESLWPIVICDLDGTLALRRNRGIYDFAKCASDAPNPPIRRLIHTYHETLGYQIIYLSGREDKFRKETREFLREHQCPHGLLLMRTTGDHRSDDIVKREIFDAHIRGKYYVDFILDDRDRVVKMWRSLGLTCLQVADGAF